MSKLDCSVPLYTSAVYILFGMCIIVLITHKLLVILCFCLYCSTYCTIICGSRELCIIVCYVNVLQVWRERSSELVTLRTVSLLSPLSLPISLPLPSGTLPSRACSHRFEHTAPLSIIMYYTLCTSQAFTTTH